MRTSDVKRRAVAKRRSLFDDPAEEINQLTDIVKKRITHLSAEVKDLEVRNHLQCTVFNW